MSAATPVTAPSDDRSATTDGRGLRRSSTAARRLLAIAGLCGIAIAQPILDLLGGSPETFQVNRIEGSSIALFAIGVVVVPPLVLWLVGEGTIGLNRRAGRLVHVAIVATLCGLFGILAGREVSDSAAVNTLAGLGFAVVGAYAYLRFEAFGAWIRLLSVANLFFLGQFVLLAPVADWIGGGTQSALELEGESDEPLPSVLMLVFDEWPTQSILADDETVDEVRFPNLASFAGDSTWYRHFTTVSPFTQSAVPALLDGRDPNGEATWNDHPESLFSLLAGSHNLVVSESVTQLCGFDSCGARPVPPPPPDDAEVTAPALPDIDTGPRWGRIVDVAWEAWADLATPGRLETTESFDDFEEEITSAEPELQRPGAGPSDAESAVERYVATRLTVQPNRHVLFVDALRPTDEPFLGFFHLILPHQPWTLRENGSPYDVTADRVTLEGDNDDPWPVKVAQQRHLLQAEYADRLLGSILDRLKEIDEYDDTLIVVAGDHGVAFEANEFSRRVSEGNLEQIAYALLFIKAPGQDSFVIDDSNVNSTDVTPTIADLLGIELPWETDGRPAASDEIDERQSDKYIYSFTDAFDYKFLGVVEFDDDVAYGDLLSGRFPAISENDQRLAGLYSDVPGSDLIGRSPDSVLGAVKGAASVADLDRLLRPGADRPLLGEVAGQVTDAPAGSAVVVAANDRIVGVSFLYRRSGEENSFVILLPADALDRSRNTIRLGLRHPDGTIDELALAAL